jgi:hypothetical protein
VGSFEQLVVRVEEAVKAASIDIFGEHLEVELVGTFQGYALVLAEDGRAARVKWNGDSGAIELVHHELIQISSFGRDEVGSYLKTEAKKAIRSLAKGEVSEAMEKIKSLLPYINQVPVDRPEAIETLISLHSGDRSWKRFFVEKADVIRRTILDEAESLQRDRLHPKFRALYGGVIAESDLETYKEVVFESLENVSVRAQTLSNQIIAAVGIAKQKSISGEHSALVTSLFAFADDLVHDLSSVKKTVTEAVRLTKSITPLSKLHDALAGDFHDREVAGRFVIRMCERLGNT